MCEKCEDRERFKEIHRNFALKKLRKLELEKINSDYLVQRKMELIDLCDKLKTALIHWDIKEAKKLVDELYYQIKNPIG